VLSHIHRYPRVVRLAASAALVAAAVGVPRLEAQEPVQARIDSLSAELAAVAARLDSLEHDLCPAERTTVGEWVPSGDPTADSLSVRLDRLVLRLGRLEIRTCPRLAAAAEAADDEGRAAPAPSDELAALRAAADSVAAVVEEREAQPAPTGTRGLNALNPEITVTADLRGELREGESPQEDSFSLHEVEFSFQSNLDPISKTKVFGTFEDDEFAIEEAYVYWTGLPGHTRVDAGKLRAELGDLNRWHLHALPEGSYPLVYERFFGEEGLASTGVSVYAPLPFSVAGGAPEVWIQATTVDSENLAGDSRQLLLLGRLKTFWQLTRSSYIQAGFTALGANDAEQSRSNRVYGADLRFTFRPPRSGARRDLTLRAEGYRFRSSQDGDITNRYGFFAGAAFRVDRRWVLGARYDWAESPRGVTDARWAVTPTVTWWQSESVYLRLEARHENGDQMDSRSQIGLQIVWALGPHKHETY